MPILLPLQEDVGALAQRLDGLLIPGGDDFAPPRPYPPQVRFETVPARQLAFDRALLAAALARRLPVLAICYGMQLLALQAGRRAASTTSRAISRRRARTGFARAGRPPRPRHRARVAARAPARRRAAGREQPAPPGGRRGRARAARLRARDDGLIEAIESEDGALLHRGAVASGADAGSPPRAPLRGLRRGLPGRDARGGGLSRRGNTRRMLRRVRSPRSSGPSWCVSSFAMFPIALADLGGDGALRSAAAAAAPVHVLLGDRSTRG